jgi:hypothetical protein
MKKEFELTESDELNNAIEEFVTGMKQLFTEGHDKPSIWMILKLRGQFEWLQIPGSEKAFETEVDNRSRRIRLFVKSVFTYIKKTEKVPVELKAVVAVSDAYFTVHSMTDEEKNMTADEHIKKLVNSPDYVEPRNDPNHIEAFLIAFCFKDSNKTFMYEYDRKDGEILYKGGNMDFDMQGGGFTRIYPQDL